MCSIFYFQFSLTIDDASAYMINWDCKHEEFPIGKECSRKWAVYDAYNRDWVLDNSVSLRCTSEGILNAY